MKIHEIKSHKQWLELRAKDITSTEVSCLFGLNPWMTEFELWHRKANNEIVQIEENERMVWGNRLEAAIANGIADDHGWKVMPFKDYGRRPDLRAGSSFDFRIYEPFEALLEIKNVDSLQFKNKWLVEDGHVVEAPPHIELQAQHQLMVSGLPLLYIGALVGGNSVTLLKRTPDMGIIKKIENKIEKFWESQNKNEPPEPDFIKDANFISELYNSAEPGKVLISEDQGLIQTLAEKYRQLSDYVKDIEAKRQGVKAQILMKIGDAEKVKGEKFTISSGIVGPTQVNFERKGYRSFRIHFKKGDR